MSQSHIIPMMSASTNAVLSTTRMAVNGCAIRTNMTMATATSARERFMSASLRTTAYCSVKRNANEYALGLSFEFASETTFRIPCIASTSAVALEFGHTPPSIAHFMSTTIRVIWMSPLAG